MPLPIQPLEPAYGENYIHNQPVSMIKQEQTNVLSAAINQHAAAVNPVMPAEQAKVPDVKIVIKNVPCLPPQQPPPPQPCRKSTYCCMPSYVVYKQRPRRRRPRKYVCLPPMQDYLDELDNFHC